MMIYIIDIFVPTLDYAHYTRIIHSTLCSNLTYFMTAVVWSKRWTVRSLLACYWSRLRVTWSRSVRCG